MEKVVEHPQPLVSPSELPLPPQLPHNLTSVAVSPGISPSKSPSTSSKTHASPPKLNHQPLNIDAIHDIDEDYFNSFPPGYRFCPYDDELVLHYLKEKIYNKPLPKNKIVEVNLYRYNPRILAENFKHYGEKEWYFFTPRDRKYKNGNRPNRAAGDGYWKATGADKKIYYKHHCIGYRKALVFYLGKPPKGTKTNWIMHEYRVSDPPQCQKGPNGMRLDDWVLCRIYEKVDKPNPRNRQSRQTSRNDETDVSDQNMDYDQNTMTEEFDGANPCFNQDTHFEAEEQLPPFPPQFNNVVVQSINFDEVATRGGTTYCNLAMPMQPASHNSSLYYHQTTTTFSDDFFGAHNFDDICPYMESFDPSGNPPGSLSGNPPGSFSRST